MDNLKISKTGIATFTETWRYVINMEIMKKKRVPGLQQAQIFIFIGLALIIGAMALGLYLGLTDMNDDLEENISISSDFNQAILHLKSSFGYTGFIHNFKNYVLRG